MLSCVSSRPRCGSVNKDLSRILPKQADNDEFGLI